MDKKSMKYKMLILVIALTALSSLTNAKVIRTNTKLPLEVKHTETSLNQTNIDLLNPTNLMTKLSSNEIDPNVHPIESSSPPLAEEPETPITNEIIPETPAVENSEVSPDVSPNVGETNPINEDDPNPINKFCKCSEYACDCCRTFTLPILPVRAPTCARVRYLGNEKMSIQLKYGDVVLVTRTVSGKRAPPICIPMPGGFNQFCGRVYGLSKGPNDFKACLGFELRAEDDVEAQLRVSCFKFGAQGFSVAEAEPLPPETEKDDDDDDDDFFGLVGDDDDEADEADDAPDDEDSGDDDDGIGLFGGGDDDEEEEPDYPTGQESPDYGGFSLLDELFDTGESKKLKGNATQIKSTQSTKSPKSPKGSEKSVQATEKPATKEMVLDDAKEGENTDKKKKVVKKGSEEDDDDYDDDDDEEDDEDDDSEDDDEEGENSTGNKTNTTQTGNKVKKEKFSTIDYFLDFVTKLVKLF